MAYLKLSNVNKVYPNGFQAVYDFNIEINHGDFVALLGPSGCGKSTTLRMIAGLEEISSGEMILENKKINGLPPKDRDIAMVFQDYALYPNLTVYENIGFSLIIRKATKEYIHEEVMKAAEMLGLVPFLRRKPSQLSGGQRQRVALGRTIVRKPKLFLMDEPMSNLDAKLRNEMRVELVELHKKINATTVYVTHDQIEALTMANIIVVMSHGYVQQIGSPTEIYDYPENIFVASFVGVPTISLISGTINKGYFVAGDISLKLTKEQTKLMKDYENKEVVLGIRPEYYSNSDKNLIDCKDSTVKVEVEIIEHMGNEYFIHSTINETKIVARVNSTKIVNRLEKIDLAIDIKRCHFFDKESEKRIKEVENENISK